MSARALACAAWGMDVRLPRGILSLLFWLWKAFLFLRRVELGTVERGHAGGGVPGGGGGGW
jgi:hypothetical protein